MRRIIGWASTTVTLLVLLFGYHTSTSSRMAGGTTSVLAAPNGATSGTTTGPTPRPSRPYPVSSTRVRPAVR